MQHDEINIKKDKLCKELAPCPFCSGRARIHICETKKSRFIYCEDCRVRTRKIRKRESAIKEWNELAKTYADKILYED
ncbi:MAG: Lar family restriction alleviation protein [Synergistaceae bacterium]|nr:Lar family restriction alleviation protein [Synergistaceae bacterium]